MARRGKEWRPGKLGGIDEVVAEMIEEAIDGQRSITNYERDDEGWQAHVADRTWDLERYRSIGYNSGMIAALLNLADHGVRISPGLAQRAGLYVYGY